MTYPSYTTLVPIPQIGQCHSASALPEYLTTREVGKILRIKKSDNVTALITSGELRGAFVGRSYLIRRSDLDAFLEGRVGKGRVKAA